MNENSIDDFFENNPLEEDVYYEGSIDINPIEIWLEENAIIEGEYTIEYKTEKIDIQGNIIIDIKKDISELPYYIQFNKVTGDFKCLYKKLESLKGFPKIVGKDFDCSSCNSLKNLEHAPIKVGGDFNCSNCYSLESLAGMPETLSGSFYCVNCTSLKTLESALKEVAGNFDCSGCNSLESLESAPKVKGNFTCPGRLVK